MCVRSPLFPQAELVEYCRKEGIVLQAYASLGGQDTGKKVWAELFGKVHPAPATTTPVATTSEDGKKAQRKLEDVKPTLLNSPTVMELARELSATHHINVTPAQVLLRWGLEQGAVLIPKTTSRARMLENMGVFDVVLTPTQVHGLSDALWAVVHRNHPDRDDADLQELTRLCWRSDPLRMLNFD